MMETKTRLLLISALVLLASCGLKGPPTLDSYRLPARPDSLTAFHREHTITLRWSYPGDDLIAGFSVMRDSGAGLREIAFLKHGSSYQDTDFEPEKKYTYQVAARGLRGQQGEGSELLKITPKTPPDAPRQLSVKVRVDSVILSWTHADNTALFNVYELPDVYKLTEAGTRPPYPINKSALKAMSYTLPIQTARAVYYAVTALRGGPIASEGPMSDTVRLSPEDYVPSRPEGLEVIRVSSGVRVLWQENPEAWIRGYKIYVIDGAGSVAPKEAGVVEIPAFLHTGKPLGNAAAYRVCGLGPVSEGPCAEVRAH